MYLDQCMNAMFAAGDDFYKEGRAFIPKQPDTARVTCGVHPVGVSVRESVYYILSPSLSDVGLDDD